MLDGNTAAQYLLAIGSSKSFSYAQTLKPSLTSEFPFLTQVQVPHHPFM